MPKRRLRSNAAIVFLAAALTAGGCGGTTSQARAPFNDPHPLPADTLTLWAPEIGTHGGRFVIGQTNSPKTFNAIMANETSSTDVTNQMFVTLANFNNGEQTTYGWLAKSWDVSEDGRVYTFHLRRGAAFSDGTPITSADVLFSFEVAYDKVIHPSIQDLLKIDDQEFKVSAPDPETVVVEIPRPYALFISAVGSLRIMPRHVLEPAYRAGNFPSSFGVNTHPDSLVTSGPWKLKEFAPGEKTVLTRNPYYFAVDAEGQRLPYLEELVFLIVPDQNTAALKFQAGDLDALDNVKPEDYVTFEQGQQQGDYTLYDVGPALSTNFFWFNLNKVREARGGKAVGAPQVGALKYSWFAQKEFRRAVSMAIDRQAMINGPFYGEAVLNWSQMTAGNGIWYDPNLKGVDYDPDAAKKALDALGMIDRDGDGVREDRNGNKLSFTLKTNSDNLVRVALCNLIKDDLSKVGIEASLTPVDFNTLITNLRQDFQYDVILLGLQSGVPPDPGMGQNVWRSTGLTHFWNIKQPRPETPAEARIDQLISENVSTIDMDVRLAAWREIEAILTDESFVIWLPTLKAKVPVRNRFGNLWPVVIPHRIIWNIEQVYAKPRGTRA